MTATGLLLRLCIPVKMQCFCGVWSRQKFQKMHRALLHTHQHDAYFEQPSPIVLLSRGYAHVHHTRNWHCACERSPSFFADERSPGYLVASLAELLSFRWSYPFPSLGTRPWHRTTHHVRACFTKILQLLFAFHFMSQFPPLQLAVSPIQSNSSVGGVIALDEENTSTRRTRQKARLRRRAEEWWKAGGGVRVDCDSSSQVKISSQTPPIRMAGIG